MFFAIEDTSVSRYEVIDLPLQERFELFIIYPVKNHPDGLRIYSLLDS